MTIEHSELSLTPEELVANITVLSKRYPNDRFYFAYGANTNMEAMKFRCPTAVPLGGVCILPGHRLVVRDYMDIESDCMADIRGIIWHINGLHEVLLDIYEDYPVLYKKEYRDIKWSNGHHPISIRCAVYKMTDMAKIEELGPTEDYIELVKAGYEDCGIPSSQLEKALMRIDYLPGNEAQTIKKEK